MKRQLRVLAIVVASLVLLLSAALLFCIKSDSIHQYIISRVNTMIPGTLSLDRLHISLFAMRAEIRNLTLADSSGTKMAGFDLLAVDISPIALIGRTLDIKEIVLDHPWARLEIDSDGRLTLLNAFPTGNPAADSDSTVPAPVTASRPFVVKLHSLAIIGGAFLFATHQDSLTLHAQGLSINATGETNTFSGEVHLTFDTLALEKSGRYIALQKFALDTRLRNMNIDTVTLGFQTGTTSFNLSGSASDLTKDPRIALVLNSTLSLDELGPVAGLDTNCGGTVTLRVGISGNASNPDCDVDLAYGGGTIFGTAVEALHMKTHLHNKVIELKSLFAQTPSGSITIQGTIDAQATFPDGFLNPPVSLQELSYQLNISSEGIYLDNFSTPVSGVAALSVSLAGKGVHPDSLWATLNLAASVDSMQLDTSSSPLAVAVTCSSSIALREVRVHSLIGTFGTAHLALNGTYGITAQELSAALQFTAPHINELARFCGTDSVSGSVSVAVTAEGTVKQPHLSVKVQADTIGFGSIDIGTIALSALLEKNGMAHVRNLDLHNKSSRLRLEGSAHVLDKGTLVPLDKMRFSCSLSSQQLNIEDFIDSIKGVVDINAAVNGTVSSPEGEITLIVNDFYAAGQPVQKILLDARLEKQQIILQPLQITLRQDQKLSVFGWISLTDSFAITLQGRNIHLNTLSALASLDSLDGIVSIDARAGATFDNPDVTAAVEINNIRKGALSLDDIRLDLDLHEQLARISGNAIGKINAAYHLKTADFSADLMMDNLALKPYLALSGHDLDGTLSASLNVSGNAAAPADASGSFTISELDIVYASIPVIATDHLRISLEKSRYSVENFTIKLAGEANLSGHASGHIDGPHEAVLRGTVPLAIARHFTSDFPDIEGLIALDASFNGSMASPQFNADIQLRDIGMTIPGLTGRLHTLNGQIIADNQSVRIRSLRGNIDDGVFSVSAALKLDNFNPSDLTADIDFKSLPLGVPDMLDCVLDGKLKLSGNPDTSQFTGDIILLDGLYYQNVVINPLSGMGQRKRKTSAPPKENKTPYVKNMRFDVGIRAHAPFLVDNNLAQLTIVPDLQLAGTVVTPTLNGRANVQEGTITYQKKVFTVQRGIIDFVNPYAIEPQIDLSGVVQIRDIAIKIDISGTPDELVFKLSDSTGLEDQDLLSLLVIGKTTSELQGGIAGMSGEQSSEQMLASLVASTFGDDIKKVTGFDMLKVQTGDDTNKDSDRIAVTIGKQLTKRLGTSYTVEYGSGETIQRATADYRILQNLGIAAYQDTKGIFGGEVRFTWEKR